MKSIMQEASSIAKAIEQGWIKAGQPGDFSIKILEQPQKNFFGMTVHPAKIALYFDEKPAQQQRYHESPAHKQRKIQVRELHEQGVAKRPERIVEQRAPELRNVEPKIENNQRLPQRYEAQWDQAMINYVREWLTHVLQEACGKQVAFTIEPNNLYLRITFVSPVLDNQDKEKRLFASLSLLILEALKRNFRTGLRKHKIILTHS